MVNFGSDWRYFDGILGGFWAGCFSWSFWLWRFWEFEKKKKKVRFN